MSWAWAALRQQKWQWKMDQIELKSICICFATFCSLMAAPIPSPPKQVINFYRALWFFPLRPFFSRRSESEEKLKKIMFRSLEWSVSIWFIHKLHRLFRFRWHQAAWSGQSSKRWDRRLFRRSSFSQSIDGLSEFASTRKTHLHFNMLLANILPFAYCPHSPSVLARVIECRWIV